MSTELSFVLSQFMRVTNRRTDGRTDRWTDTFIVASTLLSAAPNGVLSLKCTKIFVLNFCFKVFNERLLSRIIVVNDNCSTRWTSKKSEPLLRLMSLWVCIHPSYFFHLFMFFLTLLFFFRSPYTCLSLCFVAGLLLILSMPCAVRRIFARMSNAAHAAAAVLSSAVSTKQRRHLPLSRRNST